MSAFAFNPEGSFPEEVQGRLIDWWWDESDNPGGFMDAWRGGSDFWMGFAPSGTVIQYRHEAGCRRILMWFPDGCPQTTSGLLADRLRAAFTKTLVVP